VNQKLSRFMFALAVLITCSSSALAEEFEQVFIQKYKQEMLPELRLAKTDRYMAQGLSKEQINIKLEKLATDAAHCQFKTFQAYESKYQQVAYNALLDGSTTEDAALQLNEALSLAVDNGKISEDELSRRVKNAMDLYAACVVNSDLVNK